MLIDKGADGHQDDNDNALCDLASCPIRRPEYLTEPPYMALITKHVIMNKDFQTVEIQTKKQ